MPGSGDHTQEGGVPSRRTWWRRAQAPPVDAAHLPAGVPPRFNLVRDVVEALAEDPGRAALNVVDAEGVIDRSTFARIAAAAAQWAQLLALVGVQPRDRVAIAVGATDWHAVYLGALKLGAVPVMMRRDAPAETVAERSAAAGARLLLTDDVVTVGSTGTQVPILALSDARPRLGSLARIAPTFDTSATDPAAIVFSEDTARDRPVAVVHAHAAAYGARAVAEHWLTAGPGDVVWCTAPLGSPESLWLSVCGAWGVGAESVVHAAPFDPAERLDLIDRLGVTVLCQTGNEYDALLDALHGRRHTSRLRHAVVLGPVSEATVAGFRAATGLTLLAGVSTVETGLLLAHEIGDEPASLGRPPAGLDVCVVDRDGRELPAGAEGEIAVRGRPATLFTGYWRAPEATDAVFLGETYLTGLRGAIAPDGSFQPRGTAPLRAIEAIPPVEPVEPEEPAEPVETPVFEITPLGGPEEARLHEEAEARAADRQRQREEQEAERRAREERARAEREAAEERKRAEAEAKAARKAEEAERKRLEAEARAAEKARQQEERRLAKEAEAARKREEAGAREAEERRREEERRQLTAAQAAEAERQRAEAAARAAEEQRLAAEREAEEQRLAAERAAEEQRLAEENAAAEARAAAERAAEEQRLAEEQRRAEEQRLAEERAAEERRVEEERRQVEEAEAERRRAEAQAAADARARAAEERREAEVREREAAETRAAEEERQRAEAQARSSEEERSRRGWRRRRPENADEEIDDDALDAEAQRITASLIERLSAFSHEGPARPSATNGHEDRGAARAADEEQSNDADRA